MGERLPIDAIRERFRSAFAGARDSGTPLVVAAPTGSGKSTRLPGWMAADTGGRILVVEPRRVACRALAVWLSGDEPLGTVYGYRVRFDEQAGRETSIVFVTPGVLLSLIARDELNDYAAVLVDEFHERGWEVDLAVTLLRMRGQALVLCSATLDTQSLCERLGATLVTSEGRAFPVAIEYRGEGQPSSQELAVRVAEATRASLADDAGDILVFLPGKAEIERCETALNGIAARCVPLHGGLAPDVLTRAFAPTRERKVFLATNVAETSLTVPGVTTVIDSGLARMRLHQAGRAVLAVVPISGAAMDQRAGRAGRVAPGRCIRLWSESFTPELVTPPEIQRIDLDDVLLRAAACGLSSARILEAPWVTVPPAFAVESAHERLRRAGVLDEAGALTRRGQAQARLPVSWLGAQILAAASPELAGVLANLVAVLEVRRDLLLPVAGSERAVLEARRALFAGAGDEVEVALRCLAHGDPRVQGLHRDALKEARQLASSLRRQLGLPAVGGDEVAIPAGVLRYLLERVPEAAFVRRARAERSTSRKRAAGSGRPALEPWGNGACELQLRPFSIPGLEPDEQPPSPVAGLVLDDEWLGVGRGARGVGRMLLRCRLDDLAAAGLGTLEVEGARLLRPPGSRDLQGAEVRAVTVRRYAGVELVREETVLSGRPLAEALAHFIVRGTLRKGLVAAVEDDLHAWRLLRSWVEVHGPGDASSLPVAPGDVTAYLSERLAHHGVDRAADLDLLEDADLRVELEAMAVTVGIGPSEFRRLREDFPRLWVVPGGVYGCSVDVRKRLVVLEPAVVQGKGDPPAKLLPRFRGFAVEYRKASRRVRLR